MTGPDDRRPRRALRKGGVLLLPLLLLVGGVVLDLETPRGVSAAACFSAAPVVAAPLLSLSGTVLVGLAACATDLAVLAHFGALRDPGAFSEWVTVAVMAVVAVLLNLLLRHREMRFQSVRSVAAAVQRAVLPQPPPRIGTLSIAARYEAAQADAQLGGDLYAVQDTPYGVRCLIGDVRGKGMGAVEAVTVVLGAFREAAQHEPTLTGLAARIDQSLLRESALRDGIDQVEDFTTAVLAEIPRPGDRVRLINRGHPAPLLLLEGTVRTLEPARPALPLGLAMLAADPGRTDTVAFPPGASLLLYTDGLTEARDPSGTFYDPADRLAGQCPRSPDALLAAVVADVRRHTRGQVTDDMALLALTRLMPTGRAPGPTGSGR
ncbi:membrane protein [Streptomyces spiralis]|uniref:Membrane protein n=1 Tax=Streptomyces spiralis TaxID=66376 RepID=A0A919DTI2_9ACTN|nr:MULTISPECIES: PP2C family protein-serine/threonine phosphatase [Streptomyces]GHE79469.1 membrane protein [Streptomyces spiralis]